MLNKKPVKITLFVLAFSVSFLFVSIIKNNAAKPYNGKNKTDEIDMLKQELINEKQKNIALNEQILDLNSIVNDYRADAAKNSSGSKAIAAELETMRIAAGVSSVYGEGVVITVTDSSLLKTGENLSDYIIHDRDLRDVVNELFGAGAEAVSINGERIVTSTAIRCVGNTILINGIRCAPPFKITALGNKDTLESAVNMPGGIAEELKNYKIGFDVQKQNKVVVPAYSGNFTFKYAKTDSEQ